MVVMRYLCSRESEGDLTQRWQQVQLLSYCSTILFCIHKMIIDTSFETESRYVMNAQERGQGADLAGYAKPCSFTQVRSA